MYVKQQVIYLSGGCFWGVEAYISRLKGVNQTEVGYANGKTHDPTYESVCSGKTGHSECVKVTYNPEIISLNTILEEFFKIIDPYSLNRQGNDIGTQYKTGIYWQESSQEKVVIDFLKQKQLESYEKIVVEAHEIYGFYHGEEYHQKYLEKNPRGYCHVDLNLINNEEFEHLTPEQYKITQLSMTEHPFSGEYNKFNEEGIYVDVVNGEVLFTSKDKIQSDCGWPSFTKPITDNAIIKHRDFSSGMVRTEVRSKTANSHLGHEFNDGPNGSKRYCINSAALRFIAKKDLKKEGYGEYINIFD